MPKNQDAIPISEFFYGIKAPKKSRRENPETPITREIRNLLHLLRIPHLKHWGGPFSEKGVSDLIGTLPGPGPMRGRALFIEVKVPGKEVTDHQKVFLENHANAGAICMVAHSAKEVLANLSISGYEPAKRIKFGGY